MNVEAAWDQSFTGKGIVVFIVNDGLEWTHPDIIENYDHKASTDLIDYDPDPTPAYDKKMPLRLGIHAAGIITSKPDDSSCGVGIA